jgi:methylation protein EvaC
MKKEFLNLGKQPIANKFIIKDDIKNEFFYHLNVGFDNETFLVTQMEYVNPPMMFNENYTYRGSMSNTMVNHFKELSHNLKEYPFYKRDNIKILEIGSNDGVFIKNWDKKNTYAVEPCGNFAKETNELGYKTYNSFWSINLAEQIKKEVGEMDLIFAANCICHIPNLDETFKAVYNLLSKNGVFIFEDPSLAEMINNNSYDQIYDEHPHIFSVIALKNILEKNNLTIIKVENIKVHGGSNRIWVQRSDDIKNNSIHNSVKQNIEFEKLLGLDDINTFFKFADRVKQSKIDLINFLTKCKKLGKKVISYGATSKSTTIFNYCGIDNFLIEYVIDTTPEKQNKLTPGSHIPIFDKPEIPIDVDFAYLGAWNFSFEITQKESKFLSRGGKFITHVPIVKFV